MPSIILESAGDCSVAGREAERNRPLTHPKHKKMQYAVLRSRDGTKSVFVDAIEYSFLRAQKPIPDEPPQPVSALVWKLAYGAFLVPPGHDGPYDGPNAVRQLWSYEGSGFGRLTSAGTCRLAEVRGIDIVGSSSGRAGVRLYPCAVLLRTGDDIPHGRRDAISLFPRFAQQMDVLANMVNRPGLLLLRGEETRVQDLLNPNPPKDWWLLVKSHHAWRLAARYK